MAIFKGVGMLAAMRAALGILFLCLSMTAYASSIRVPLTPESNTIDQVEGFALIEKLAEPAGLYRVRIVVPKASSVLPVQAIALIMGKRDNPDVSVDLAVVIGGGISAETTFEISDKHLGDAIVSVLYANPNRSSASVFYELRLKDWLKEN